MVDRRAEPSMFASFEWEKPRSIYIDAIRDVDRAGPEGVTAPGVRRRARGNGAGTDREETPMLADIVIPGIIVLVLVILLIVYLVRRA
jgi:hypothetical protein